MAFLFDSMVLELAEKLPEFGKDEAGIAPRRLAAENKGIRKRKTAETPKLVRRRPAGRAGRKMPQYCRESVGQSDACRCPLWIFVRVNESERAQTKSFIIKISA